MFIIFTQFLFANVSLDDFIKEQIKVEAQLLDQNISLEEKIKIKKNQEKEYQGFLLHYASHPEKYVDLKKPYHHEISKLKLRLRNNKHLGNTNAVMRDEVLLRGYKIRDAIKDALQIMMQYTDSESKEFFKDKLDEMILKYFSKEPFDKKKYITSDQNLTSPIVRSLKKALQTLTYIENVGRTFSSEMVENYSHIYRTAKLSKSKFLRIINIINTSTFGQKINEYLSPLDLDIASILLILGVILIIFFIQFIIRYMVNNYLNHYAFQEDDIDYIHSHITRLFNIITSLFILHLILVVYLGIDTQSIVISKIFGIIYVLLVALLLYRIANTVAYLKMEGIRNNKLFKNEIVNLLIKAYNVFIFIVATITILKILGVNLTALLSGLGIFGAAVAFAAKDSIANIFGSISILAGDVFEQGDWIESKDKDVNGTVVEIGLRATTIRTFDNALISIPNSELANNGVKNWSRRSIGRRIKMNIGVTYESDFKNIRKAVEDIKEMLKEHPGIANERTEYQNVYRQAKLVSTEDFKGVKRTTLVYMDEFSDSSINILVYCFTRSVVWNEWLEVKEDVMYKIAEILENNNLDFAYPTLMIHQAKDDIG